MLRHFDSGCMSWNAINEHFAKKRIHDIKGYISLCLFLDFMFMHCDKTHKEGVGEYYRFNKPSGCTDHHRDVDLRVVVEERTKIQIFKGTLERVRSESGYEVNTEFSKFVNLMRKRKLDYVHLFEYWYNRKFRGWWTNTQGEDFEPTYDSTEPHPRTPHIPRGNPTTRVRMWATCFADTYSIPLEYVLPDDLIDRTLGAYICPCETFNDSRFPYRVYGHRLCQDVDARYLRDKGRLVGVFQNWFWRYDCNWEDDTKDGDDRSISQYLANELYDKDQEGDRLKMRFGGLRNPWACPDEDD